MSHKIIKIGGAQGFWGDSLEAPLQLVTAGKVDYLVFDYLAELTMSILAKQKQKDPTRGYAHDFVDTIERLLPYLIRDNVKVLANAGGVNPWACGQAIRSLVDRLGFGAKVKIAVVSGDDILQRLEEFQRQGVEFKNLDTAQSFKEIAGRAQSANVYLGAEPLVRALSGGATIVVTGRVADAALPLACMMYEYGWKIDDWDKLALGTIAGHVIECGAQASGGNCSCNWSTIPDLATIGYPIIEVDHPDSLCITKHLGSGGRIDLASVKEQLVYEIGDPSSYITPDVIADFTSISLEQEGKDRVRISNARGRARTDHYKVSLSYQAGYKAEGSLIYSWPDAAHKAQAAARIIQKRLAGLGLQFDQFYSECIGLNACHGKLGVSANSEPAEVMMRVAVRGTDRKSVERFTREIAPLVLNGPPSVSGYTSGRPRAQEIFAYWPTLIPRALVKAELAFL